MLHRISHNLLIAIIIALITFVSYTFTAIKSPTPFNYFTRLADSFLQGRLYLTESPPWLNELVKDHSSDKWYVVYPPMPAIIAIPMVMLYGVDASQTSLSILIATFNALLAYQLSRKFLDPSRATILTIALVFGTNHWYIASEGSSWYIAHILAIFFTFCAMHTLFIRYNHSTTELQLPSTARRWFLAGLFVGMAFWSRLPTILSVPFFLILPFINVKLSFPVLWQRFQITQKYLYSFVAGVLIFIILNAGYNYVRFGTFGNIAYEKINGVLEEPWYHDGIFSTAYLTKNIEFITLKMPLPHQNFPYVKPSMEGMSLFLTSPFLLALLFIKWRHPLSVTALLAGLTVLTPALLHGTPGFAQFGYRFALDSMPYFLLALISVFQRRRWWFIIPLVILSIIINYWGIYFIRTLDQYGW